MNERLDPDFVARERAMLDGPNGITTTFMGVSVHDLKHDELEAVVGWFIKAEERARQDVSLYRARLGTFA